MIVYAQALEKGSMNKFMEFKIEDHQELLADDERYMQNNYSLYLKHKNGEKNPTNEHFATCYADNLMNNYKNFSLRYKLINGNYQIKNLDFLIEIETFVVRRYLIEPERYDALQQAYKKVLETEKNSNSYKNALDLLFEKYQDYFSSLSFFSNDTYQIIYNKISKIISLLEEEGYIEKTKEKTKSK